MFTKEQIEAWMKRNDFQGSYSAAKAAMEDAKTLENPKVEERYDWNSNIF